MKQVSSNATTRVLFGECVAMAIGMPDCFAQYKARMVLLQCLSGCIVHVGEKQEAPLRPALQEEKGLYY